MNRSIAAVAASVTRSLTLPAAAANLAAIYKRALAEALVSSLQLKAVAGVLREEDLKALNALLASDGAAA